MAHVNKHTQTHTLGHGWFVETGHNASGEGVGLVLRTVQLYLQRKEREREKWIKQKRDSGVENV